MSFPHEEATGLGTPPLTLPFARRPDVGGPTVLESLKIPIEAEVFTRLLSVASDLDLVLLAVWQTLLWRFTDQSEVVVGWLSQDRTQDQSRAAMALTFSEDLTLFDIVQQLHKSKPRAAEPQTQLQHSNADQLSVGFQVEKVSGQATVPSYASRFQLLRAQPPRLHRLDSKIPERHVIAGRRVPANPPALALPVLDSFGHQRHDKLQFKIQNSKFKVQNCAPLILNFTF